MIRPKEINRSLNSLSHQLEDNGDWIMILAYILKLEGEKIDYCNTLKSLVKDITQCQDKLDAWEYHDKTLRPISAGRLLWEEAGDENE